MTRDEHLEWAKQRALKYVDAARSQWASPDQVRETLLEAFTSMASDLSKHPELENHKGIELGMMFIMMPNSNYLSNPDDMEHFIEDFY